MDDDGNEKVGAVDAAGIGAFSTSAAGIVLGELLPQSPPNGEYDLPLDDDDDEKVGAVDDTGATGLALVALLPQSPPNGE